MNELTAKYPDLTILAFPCNQFGHQEPCMNEEELLNTLKYVRPGKGFEPNPNIMIFQRVDVNGEKEDPFFTWLKAQQRTPSGPKPDLIRANNFSSHSIQWSPVLRSDIAWNFEKFLVDRQGNFVQRYAQQIPTADLAPEIDKIMKQGHSEELRLK
jgi:glutathione peroxidase